MACSYAIGKWHVAVRLASDMQPRNGRWQVAPALAVNGMYKYMWPCGMLLCGRQVDSVRLADSFASVVHAVGR